MNIGLVAYSPLSRGFLSGQIRRLEDFAPDDFRRLSPRFQGSNFERNLDIVRRLEEIAARKGMHRLAARAWVLAQGTDIVPIPGTKRRTYLKENAAALRIALTPEEWKTVEDAAPEDGVAGARYPEAMMGSVNG